jgi:hypothetical protein
VPVNKYFNNFTYGREQDLLEDLVIESIKIYGHEMKYLPRTLVEEDQLFGEAKLSKFEDSVPVEMYIKNVEGFEGEGDLLSKFGVEIRDQMTFTIARRRFDQIRGGESLQSEVGYQIQNETANTDSPSRQFLTDTANVDGIMLESGTAGANNYTITSNRPNEGDLIYFPLTDKLFEIKFVEHEEVFYQMGRLQTYDLRCELFQYSSERIDTGDSDVDVIEDTLSADSLFNQISIEEALALAVGTVSISSNSVSSVTISEGGEYYSAPTVTFSAPGDTTGIINATYLSGYAVTDSGGNVTGSTGTGYTTGTYNLTGGSGTGAKLTVTSSGAISGVFTTLSDGGYDYQVGEVLLIDGGDQNAYIKVLALDTVENTTATGTAVLTGNTVTSVTITNGGTGYLSTPTVTFSQQTQTGDSLSHEDGDSVIWEYRLEDTDNQANNEYFTTQALSGIIDFSEANPFSEIDRW